MLTRCSPNYNKVVRQDLPAAPTDLARLLRGMLDTYPNLLPARADIQLPATAAAFGLNCNRYQLKLG